MNETILQDFLESEEWKEYVNGGYYPEYLDESFCIDVIGARYELSMLSRELIENIIYYIFANASDKIASYLLPEEIYQDEVIKCCIDDAGACLADLPEFDEELPFN